MGAGIGFRWRVRRMTGLGLALLAFAASAPSLRADDHPGRKQAHWTADIVRKKATSGGITGLGFTESTLPVTLVPADGRLRPVVTIRGRFVRPGWQLATGPRVLVARDSPDPEFQLYAALNSRKSEISLTATGPDGKVETEQLIIIAPDVQEFHVKRPWGELMASLGAASLSYFQTAFGDFSSGTGYLQLTYTSPKGSSRLGLLAEAWTTIITFSSKPANYGPEVIGVTLDATFALGGNRDPYQVALVGGVNYLTLLSNGSPFGFANLIAPELGVKGLYPLSVSSSVVGDFRYVDLASGVFSFSQAGYDFRVGYSTRLDNGHRVELGLDALLSSYSPDGSSTIRANVFALRLGYSI